MSESNHSSQSSESNPLASLVSWAFLLLIPISLVIMLGFVGVAFLQGSGYKEDLPAPVSSAGSPPAPTVASASVQTPAPAAKKAPAPPAPKTSNAKDAATAPESSPAASDKPDQKKTAAAPASGEPSKVQMTLGQTTYAMCAACHGPDGKGVQNGPMKMAPSFVGSELLLGKPEASLAAVLKGIHRAPDSPYLGQMMALGAGLDDEKVAAVVTYARNSFGNKASAVTSEQSAAARAKYATVNAPTGLQRSDLEKVAKEK